MSTAQAFAGVVAVVFMVIGVTLNRQGLGGLID
jgi:hypothetical protein